MLIKTPKPIDTVPFKELTLGTVLQVGSIHFIKCGPHSTVCLSNGALHNEWNPESGVIIKPNAILLPDGEIER